MDNEINCQTFKFDDIMQIFHVIVNIQEYFPEVP